MLLDVVPPAPVPAFTLVVIVSLYILVVIIGDSIPLATEIPSR